MRSMFKTAAAIFIMAATPIFAADDIAGNALLKAEKDGLRGVSSTRLQNLLVEPQTVGDVKFASSWIESQPEATGGPHWKCMAEALYFEARGETVKGQFAVAEVIMNRVESERFPGTVCGVINQGTGRKYQCQFTYTCDGNPEKIAEPHAFENVGKVARAVLDGRAPELTDGATHYHTTAVRPKWARVYTKTAAIGVHLFYRHTYRTASN
jgi:spore germination cell wall hydrolase CwlJ-like protein